jgi:hypothetical protein
MVLSLSGLPPPEFKSIVRKPAGADWGSWTGPDAKAEAIGFVAIGPDAIGPDAMGPALKPPDMGDGGGAAKPGPEAKGAGPPKPWLAKPAPDAAKGAGS